MKYFYCFCAIILTGCTLDARGIDAISSGIGILILLIVSLLGWIKQKKAHKQEQTQEHKQEQTHTSIYTGTILTSTDAIRWTPRISGITNRLNGVAYGSGQWVAVGSNGAILISTDLTTWTPRISGVSDYVNGIVYDNGTTDEHFSSIVYTNERAVGWVAVGDEGTILTSTNLTVWNISTNDEGVNDTLWDIAYSGDRWVAVGWSYDYLTGTYTSTIGSGDQFEWTDCTSDTTSLLNGVAYGGGRWVAVGSDGTILTSTDAISWTARTSGTGNDLHSITSSDNDLNSVTYDNPAWVAVGEDGTILTSSDTITWTPRTSGVNNALLSIAYDGGGQWVAVGRDGIILNSTDAMTWMSLNSNTTSHLQGVVYGGGQWVTVGGGTIATAP